MAQYHSRLESVFKTRKYRQEEVRMALVIQEGLLSQEKTVLQEMLEASEAAQSYLKEEQKGISPAEMQLYHEFIQHQQKRIDGQKKKIGIHTDACDAKRVALEKATQDKKMVENIVSKQREVYFTALKRKEQILLDEVAGQMRWRRG